MKLERVPKLSEKNNEGELDKAGVSRVAVPADEAAIPLQIHGILFRKSVCR